MKPAFLNGSIRCWRPILDFSPRLLALLPGHRVLGQVARTFLIVLMYFTFVISA